MRLKLENARYNTLHGTQYDTRSGVKAFDLDITDLDGGINNGKPFPYTYVDNKTSNSEIGKFIKENMNTLTIANYQPDPDPEVTLYIYRQCMKQDIDEDFNAYVTKYDAVFFDNDLFSYSQDSITIITGLIGCYESQVAENKIAETDAVHEYISNTNARHKLSYKQLKELRNLMVLRYSENKLHARSLKDKIESAQTVAEIKAVVWDLWHL